MSFIKEGIHFSGISIVKFGGSSVADTERISHAAKLISDKCKTGEKLIVVISAIGKTTDELLKLAKGTNPDAVPHQLDEILAMGERTSSRILATALSARGVKADFLDVEKEDWPIITDENHGDANIILDTTTDRVRYVIAKKMEELDVLVVPGFIGKTTDGKITTLGRGGSETTAFVIAGSLKIPRVILVSDVSGIMSADPKLIKEPEKLKEIEVEKLVGLADSGVKFLHKKALGYKPDEVEVKLISNKSESLDVEGTVIKGTVADIEVIKESDKVAASITIVGKGISDNPGLLAKMLFVFHENNVPMYGMSANHDSLVFYASEEGIEKIYEKLHEIVLENKETLAIARRGNLGVLKVNGIGLQETPGSMARAADVLRKNGINIYGQYTVMSEIFVIVMHGEEEKAAKLIEEELLSDVERKVI